MRAEQPKAGETAPQLHTAAYGDPLPEAVKTVEIIGRRAPEARMMLAAKAALERLRQRVIAAGT